jgi:hypothetical protein
VYSLIREYEKSKQAFEKALAINEALFEEEPENPIYEMNQAEHLRSMQNCSRNWAGMKKQRITS